MNKAEGGKPTLSIGPGLKNKNKYTDWYKMNIDKIEKSYRSSRAPEPDQIDRRENKEENTESNYSYPTSYQTPSSSACCEPDASDYFLAGVAAQSVSDNGCCGCCDGDDGGDCGDCNC